MRLGDCWRLLAAGCVVATMSGAASAGGDQAGQDAAYDDPFAYCAAVGTVDAPDSRWGGPAMPDPLVRRLMAASGASADAPLEAFRQGSFWRCMDGEVYACTTGANLPCTTKADTSREPEAAVRAFCSEQPEAAFVPAVVTGRATIYAWRCADGAPVIDGPPRPVDAAGYLADIWYPIAPD